MLPRAFRLLAGKRFSALFSRGHRDALGHILLIGQPNHTLETKLNCIAPAKVFPKAVDRHYAKRVAREAFRRQLSRIRPGYDMILIYRSRPQGTAWAQQIATDLETLLKRHHLLN